MGARLKEAGHEVTLVTGKGFEAMVSGRSLRYVALDVDLLELAQSQRARPRSGHRGAHCARRAG